MCDGICDDKLNRGKFLTGLTTDPEDTCRIVVMSAWYVWLSHASGIGDPRNISNNCRGASMSRNISFLTAQYLKLQPNKYGDAWSEFSKGFLTLGSSRIVTPEP